MLFCTFTGLVDWKEYYRHFLLAKKYDVGEIDDFMKDYGENSIELKEKGMEVSDGCTCLSNF